MKRLLWLLAVPVAITMPDDAMIAIIPISCASDSATVRVPDCPPVAVSTGPFILKATTGDCYRLPYINPNGTFPVPSGAWVPCP